MNANIKANEDIKEKINIKINPLKDGRIPIMLDKQRHLLCSLNVVDEIERAGGASNKLTKRGGAETLKWMATMMLNEGKCKDDELLTEKEVGKLIHRGNMEEVEQYIKVAMDIAEYCDDNDDNLEHDNSQTQKKVKGEQVE